MFQSEIQGEILNWEWWFILAMGSDDNWARRWLDPERRGLEAKTREAICKNEKMLSVMLEYLRITFLSCLPWIKGSHHSWRDSYGEWVGASYLFRAFLGEATACSWGKIFSPFWFLVLIIVSKPVAEFSTSALLRFGVISVVVRRLGASLAGSILATINRCRCHLSGCHSWRVSAEGSHVLGRKASPGERSWFIVSKSSGRVVFLLLLRPPL